MKDFAGKTELQKITIVIPTYCRHKYVLRNMHYWSERYANIVVVDGSNKPLKATVGKHFKENVRYYHIPVSIGDRLEFAMGRIDTKYAMLCGDDEFMLPSGIIDSIKYLELNADYAQCSGRAIGFMHGNNNIDLYPVKISQRYHAVDMDSVFDRVRYHLENYTPSTVYAVHHSESFKKILRATNRYSYGNGGYTAELIFELLSAAAGKSKVLPVPMWLRSSENDPVHYDGWDRKIYINDWFRDTKNVIEVQNMYQVLADTMCEIEPALDYSETTRFLTALITERMAKLDKADADIPEKKKPDSSIKKIKKSIRRKRREIIKRIIGIHPSFGIFLKHDYFIDRNHYSYSELQNDYGIHISDVNELNDVWQVVLDFYRNRRLLQRKKS